MTLQAPPGVFDILPRDRKEEWRSAYLWQQIEELIRKTTRDYGYQEIRTPIFERTELFQRGVGETSDIVSKEMYTFKDKGDRLISLRPENTAPVIRAFIEHNLSQESTVHKLFYIGPMFRYERSQAGRYRQHHQFGAEAIGNDSPEQDVEIIDMLYTFYNRLGLKNLQLCLNSIGDEPSRRAYRDALQAYLRSSYNQLSDDSKRRFEVNPLRILDSKDANDKIILQNAPSILDYLNQDSLEHFKQVQVLLKKLHIPFVVSPFLVRGLDYYNKTVFEITAGELGAQNSIGGGGRYDGLMKELGGPDLPTIGFGTGLERVIQTLLKQNTPTRPPERPVLFIIALGDQAQTACFTLLHELRQQGIPCYMDFSRRKVGKLMQMANQLQAKYLVVIGDNELKEGTVDLKEMETGDALKIPLDRLGKILLIDEKSEEIASTWSQMTKPFENQQEANFFIKKLNKKINNTKQLAHDLQSATETLKKLFN